MMYRKLKNRKLKGKSSLACPLCGNDPSEESSNDSGQSTAKNAAAITEDETPETTLADHTEASSDESSSQDASDPVETATESMEMEEGELKEATQTVVREAMKVLNPLLEKLNEANEQLKQQQPQMPSAMDMSQSGLANNLEQLQKVSEERLKNQEMKVAARMRKMQNRLG